MKPYTKVIKVVLEKIKHFKIKAKCGWFIVFPLTLILHNKRILPTCICIISWSMLNSSSYEWLQEGLKQCHQQTATHQTEAATKHPFILCSSSFSLCLVLQVSPSFELSTKIWGLFWFLKYLDYYFLVWLYLGALRDFFFFFLFSLGILTMVIGICTFTVLLTECSIISRGYFSWSLHF